MNLATLPDITEEILQEDNDKKEKVREDHLEEKSKSDKTQIVNDKTEIKEQILQEDNDIKEKVREDHLEEKSKSDKIQIVNDKTELSDIAKGGFFSESAMCFFKSPNLQKKIYSKKLS